MSFNDATSLPESLADEFRWLREAGFAVLPLPSATGRDDALLFWRIRPAYVDTVAVWSATYAVALRIPPVRDWADPFKPSIPIHQDVGSLHDVVHRLLRLRVQASNSTEDDHLRYGDQP